MCTRPGDGNDAAANMHPGRGSSTEPTRVLDPGERGLARLLLAAPSGRIAGRYDPVGRPRSSPTTRRSRCSIRETRRIWGVAGTAAVAPTRSKTFVVYPRQVVAARSLSLQDYVEKFGARGSGDDQSTGVSAVTMIPDARLRTPSIDAIESYSSISINRG
jgi:hypothetical protein